MEIQGCAGMTGETFRRLTGVRKRTFAEMVRVLEVAEATLKKQGGKPNRLTVETRLPMTLEYWREYRTYLHIGHSYGGSESTASRNIRWCEDTLIMSRVFTLPGKTALIRSEKRHTLKTQLVVDKATGTILCLAHAVGRRHDFRVLKE